MNIFIYFTDEQHLQLSYRGSIAHSTGPLYTVIGNNHILTLRGESVTTGH